MIGVVPPPDAIVQVQGVAGGVYKEGEHDEDIDGDGEAAVTGEDEPQRRDDEGGERVGERPAFHGLAGELGEVRAGDGEKQ